MASIFVLGITINRFPESGQERAFLNVSRSLTDIKTEKFERIIIGETGEVNAKFDKPLELDLDYAHQLKRNGAFVPRREYEVKLGLNMIDPLRGAIVTELLPVDDEIKKHFAASFGK